MVLTPRDWRYEKGHERKRRGWVTRICFLQRDSRSTQRWTTEGLTTGQSKTAQWFMVIRGTSITNWCTRSRFTDLMTVLAPPKRLRLAMPQNSILGGKEGGGAFWGNVGSILAATNSQRLLSYWNKRRRFSPRKITEHAELRTQRAPKSEFADETTTTTTYDPKLRTTALFVPIISISIIIMISGRLLFISSFFWGQRRVGGRKIGGEPTNQGWMERWKPRGLKERACCQTCGVVLLIFEEDCGGTYIHGRWMLTCLRDINHGNQKQRPMTTLVEKQDLLLLLLLVVIITTI